MIEIEYGDEIVELEFPSDWRDLDSAQWHSIMDLLEGSECSVPVREKLMRKCLLLVADTNDKGLLEDVLEEMDLAQLVSVFDGMEILKSPIILEKNHMPYIGILRGPKDQLLGMRWKEFGLFQEQIEVWGEAIQADNNADEVKAMCSVLAIVYRLPLLSFSSRMADVYLKLWPLFVRKKTIRRMMRQMLGLMENLREIYPETYDIKEGGEGPSLGFRGLSVSMAGNKFGDYYTLQRAYLHDVMTEMEQQAYQNRIMEEKYRDGNKD